MGLRLSPTEKLTLCVLQRLHQQLRFVLGTTPSWWLLPLREEYCVPADRSIDSRLGNAGIQCSSGRFVSQVAPIHSCAQSLLVALRPTLPRGPSRPNGYLERIRTPQNTKCALARSFGLSLVRRSASASVDLLYHHVSDGVLLGEVRSARPIPSHRFVSISHSLTRAISHVTFSCPTRNPAICAFVLLRTRPSQRP